VRRLFFTFASGPPGVGLLLLRLLAGTTVIVHSINLLRAQSPLAIVGLSILLIALGLLLVVGLWTPVAGGLVAASSPFEAAFYTGDRGYCLIIAVLALALTLIGPGAWSIDARLFGWKRL
jgi:uncharacterized membrane protein YphA (DoxX/SURF4 family)